MPHDVTVHRWLTEDSSVRRARVELPMEAPMRFFRLEVIEE